MRRESVQGEPARVPGRPGNSQPPKDIPRKAVSAPRILIADDSPFALQMLEGLLTKAGFEVVTAVDGLEAIEKAFTEDVSLVILDVMMPRMNGYQACRLLRNEESTKALPVVILTTKDRAGDRFYGIETGADYYLTKDGEPQRLLDLVRDIVERERAPRPALKDSEQRSGIDILSRVNELLDRKLYEATILAEIGRVARGLVQFDETFLSVMTLVGRVLDFTIGGMAFLEEEDLDAVILLNRSAEPAVIGDLQDRLLDVVAEALGDAPTPRLRARYLGPPGSGPTETSLSGFAAFPVVTAGRLRGVLVLGGPAAGRIAGETRAFLGQVAHQAHIVMENSLLFDRIRNLSMRDSLTDLYNHRHSMEMVANEFQRVGRYEGGVSVLMVDIDHFKSINDEYGHPVGDIVLKGVARVLKDGLRTVDSLGRYGGEEFIAILPQTPADEARQTAERLRRAVETQAFRAAGKDVHVTISVGVASHPSTAVESADALIREADRALYRAKQAGRNRVD